MPKIKKVYTLPDIAIDGEIYILRKNTLNNVTAYIGTKDNSFRAISTTEAKNICIKNNNFPEYNTLEEILVDIGNKLSFNDTEDFINFWSGSLKDYQKIDYKDQNTLYFIYAPTGFIIDTSLVENSTSFKIPIYSKNGSTADMLVNWGDGIIDRVTFGNEDALGSLAEYNGTWFKNTNPTHTYADNGAYTINIDGHCPYLSFYDAYTEAERKIYPKMLIEVASLDNIGILSLDKIFYGCENLESICSLPVNAEYESMDYSFYNCKKISNIGDLPTSLKTMNYTFAGCSLLNCRITIPDGVKELIHTFENCENFTIFPSIIGEITSIDYAFANCGFENLSSYSIPYDTISAEHAFEGCSKLINTPKLNIGLINADSMFKNCSSLENITDLSITIENAYRMFAGCLNLKEQIPNFPNYVKDITEMYANCINLTGNVPYFPGSVEACKRTFYSCFNLDGVAEDNWTSMNPKLIAKTNGEYNCYQCYLGCNNLKNYYTNYEIDGKTYPKIWKGVLDEYDEEDGWCGNSEPIVAFEIEGSSFKYQCKRKTSDAKVIIGWGDGSETTCTYNAAITHNYDNYGKYLITIREENKLFSCDDDTNSTLNDGLFDLYNEIKKVYSLNLLYAWQCNSLFHGCSELTYIHPNVFNNEWLEKQVYNNNNFGGMMFQECEKLVDADVVLPKKVSIFYNMFENCIELNNAVKFIPNTALDCSYMFNNCNKLTAYPYFELGGTKSANYSYMFAQTGTKTNQMSSISHIVIPKNVSDTSAMFSGCSRILDTCSFEFGYINDENGKMVRLNCTNMFYSNSSLIDSSNSVLPSRTNIAVACFKDCKMMKKISSGFENDEIFEDPKIIVNALNFTDGNSLYQMYMNCIGIQDASNFTIPKNNWFGMSEMFYNCSGMTISPKMHEEAYTKHFYNMFYNCKSLTTFSFKDIPCSGTNYENMFRNCTKATEIPFLRDNSFNFVFELANKFNYTLTRVYCQYMYAYCNSLVKFKDQGREMLLPLNADYSFTFINDFKLAKALQFNLNDSRKATILCNHMYSNCHSLVDISNIIIPKNTIDLKYMFHFDADQYTKDLGRNTFPTFESNSMSQGNIGAQAMFMRNFCMCSDLITIPETFKIPYNISYTSDMFCFCNKLKDASNLIIPKDVTNCAYMFNACINLCKLPEFEITTTGNPLNTSYMFANIARNAADTQLDLGITLPRRINNATKMFLDIHKNISKMPKMDIGNYLNYACNFDSLFYRTDISVTYSINDDFIIPRKVNNINAMFRGHVFNNGKKVKFADEGLEGDTKINIPDISNLFQFDGQYYWSTFDFDYFDNNNTASFKMNYTFAQNTAISTFKIIRLLEGTTITRMTIPAKASSMEKTFYKCQSNVPSMWRKIFIIQDGSLLEIFKNICEKDEMIQMFGKNIDLSDLKKCSKLKEIVVHDVNVVNIAIDPNAPITNIDISECGFSHSALNTFLLSLPKKTNSPIINLTGYDASGAVGIEKSTIEFVKNQGWTVVS